MVQPQKSRIVVQTHPEVAEDLRTTADGLRMSKAATVRLAIWLLRKLTREVTTGDRIVLKRRDNTEVEIWIPTLGADAGDENES